MRKILAALLALAMVLALVPAVMAENAPITVTVFKGDPGDQPTALTTSSPTCSTAVTALKSWKTLTC